MFLAHKWYNGSKQKLTTDEEVIHMAKCKVIAILLSGDINTGIISDIPKQYVDVDGRMIISYSMETLLKHKGIDELWIAAASKWRNYILDEASKLKLPVEKIKGFVEPAESRQMSIVVTLEAIVADKGVSNLTDEKVLIHDAARPLVREEQISKLIAVSDEHEGVMPALPMKDTVYLSDDGLTVTRLFEKNRIFAGHTPEIFNLKKYYYANILLVPEKIKLINGSSEPAVMASMDVAMIDGDEGNFKITTQTDLDRFEEIILEKKVQEKKRRKKQIRIKE